MKVKLSLRPLDTGRPDEYEGWRYAVKAELVSAGPAAAAMLEYPAAIDDCAGFTDEWLQQKISHHEEVAAVDVRLFSAILSCLGGGRRAAVEQKIRATVPFAAGALALRCLDAWFHQGAARRRHDATRELLNLQPAGTSAQALDNFLTRYRLLVQQAGDGVGLYARAEILQRAASRHSRLAMTWAAWRQGGDEDPSTLLARMEEAVAEELHSGKGAQGTSAAWAAMGSGRLEDPAHRSAAMTHDGEDEGAPLYERTYLDTHPGAWATAAQDAGGAVGPECWSCGKRGHLERGCTEGRKGKGKGKGSWRGSEAAMHERMDRLEAMIKALTDCKDAGRPKK